MVPQVTQPTHKRNDTSTWTCQACGMSGLWSTTYCCFQCGAPRLSPSKGSGKKGAKTKSKTYRDAATFGMGGKGGKTNYHTKWSELEADNQRLRAELAKKTHEHGNEPQNASPAHEKHDVATVSYGGSDVTLSQLYAMLRGMRDLPATNEQKLDVQRLIRAMQKTRANTMEPTERLKQLDQIMAKIAKDMQSAQEHHRTLLEEQDKLAKRLAKSSESIQRLQDKQNDALEDRNDAEARAAKANLHATAHTTGETLGPGFKQFLQTHYSDLHDLGAQHAWKLPKSIFAVQQQLFTRHRMYTQLLRNAVEETHWSDARKQQIHKAKEWFDEQQRFTPPDCASDVYRRVAECTPVPMDEGHADNGKRNSESGAAPEPKTPRAEGEEVTSPFLLDPIDPNKISKHLTVPSTIEYSSELEDSVLAFVDSFETAEESCEVPPVPNTYPSTQEARFAAEFHHAIWKNQSSWNLFPAYDVYLHARKTGRFGMQVDDESL